MEATEIRVYPNTDTNGSGRVLGYAAVTLDGELTIHDIKIINGDYGPYLSMPSREVRDKCASCGSKNSLRSRYCGRCGVELPGNRDNCTRCSGKGEKLVQCGSGVEDSFVECDSCGGSGRRPLYADVIHPIVNGLRRYLEGAVIKAYQAMIGNTTKGTVTV